MPALEKNKNALNPKKTSPAKVRKAHSSNRRASVSPTPNPAIFPPHSAPNSSILYDSIRQLPQQQRLQPFLPQDYYTAFDTVQSNQEPYKNGTVGISVYGDYLPPILKTPNYDVKLKQYEIMEFEKIGRYYVKEELGDRTYLIKNDTGDLRFLKIEAVLIDTNNWPSIEREIAFIHQAACDRTKTQHNNFFPSLLSGIYAPDRFRYIVTPAGECNLVDLKSRIGSRFSPASFVHIAAQTLQCVHNVHLYGYMHGYVAPKNFIIGRGIDYKTVYIVNFCISHETKPERKDDSSRGFKKFANLGLGCMPRSAHLGEKYSRIDDIESWIYCFIWLYDDTLLPSKMKMDERGIYHFKQHLFYGGYDNDLGAIKSYVNPFIHYVESYNAKNSHQFIDYTFFANIIEQMASDWSVTGKERLDWLPDVTKNNQIQYYRQNYSKAPKPKRSKAASKPDDTKKTRELVDQTQGEDAENKATTNRRKSKTHRPTPAPKRKQRDTTVARRKKIVHDTQHDDEVLPPPSKPQKKRTGSVSREKEEKKLSDVNKKKLEEDDDPPRVAKKVEKEKRTQKKKKNTAEEGSTVKD